MKKKNLFFVLILFVFFTKLTTAQEADTSYYNLERLINVTVKKSIKEQSLAPIDDLISSGSISHHKLLSYAYAEKARIMEELYADLVYKFEESDSIHQEILKYYQKAIDICKFCQLNYKEARAQFVEDYIGINEKYDSLFNADIKDLYKAGYKKSIEALGFSFTYQYGKNHSFGIDLIPIVVFQPRYKLMQWDEDEKKMVKVGGNDIPIAGSFFPLSFLYNINNGDKEFALSFCTMYSPIFVNSAKFGFVSSNRYTKNKWFYRPECGYGWDYFSVAYGYNLIFDKSARADFEKHVVIAKITIPAYRYNKKSKL